MNYSKIFEQEILDYAKKHGPKEWHSIAISWTYTFGNEPIKWIVNQKETYLATILELYWDARIENFLGIHEASASVKDELKLHAEVMELIETNIQKPEFYQDKMFAFSVKLDRYDLSKTKHIIPERLKQSTSTEQDEESPDHISEGIPVEVLNKILNPEIERAEKNPIKNSPKYWVFSSEKKYYKQRPVTPKAVQAQYGNTIITDTEQLRKIVYAMYRDDLTIDHEYIFTFMIDKKWPKVDVYDTGYGRCTELYSERTLSIYQKYGVKFRKFAVKFVDSDGSVLPSEQPYFIIKLDLPKIDALNADESLFTGSVALGVKRIILNGEKTKNEPLFYLQKVLKLMMRDDLVQELLKEKITGLWFVEAENWHSGKFGTNFVEGGRVIT